MQAIIDIIFEKCKDYIDALFAGFSGIPSGTIVAWNGLFASIPDGWVICNGSNGTPDLRDRFIICAGGPYSIFETGGSKNHSHDPGTGLQYGDNRSSPASNMPPFMCLWYIMKT